ncbi:hypothetical protein [Pandoraea pulmonicola]|uniref:Uncharacterized protein n=1 Tax=Pandoraea pulmonicola TaxID=93221 RepID=A0AAJ5CZR8_PANPU|nr:hypothetical protein [Pandoraea pulmonicola]AJC21377.1 hypothetical protein RO07_14385 [Pandoraea pulmonicola]SUA89888.1 Uncharacterised protein [Pandoraea pulmonicola]
MVEAIRDIPGSPALDDARSAGRPSAPRELGADRGTAAPAAGHVSSANATGRARDAQRAAASPRPISPASASFDKRRAYRTVDLISQHATASRASAALDWLARLHTSANAALATLMRWRDGDVASHERAHRALASLGAQWQARDRSSLGTVDDRLHFDPRGDAPRRFTVDGVAPQQWRASMPERLTLFPAGADGAGVEVDVTNAISQAGLRRRTARALAAYGITLEAPPPEHTWVMRTAGARWPSIASRFAVAEKGGASSQALGGAGGLGTAANPSASTGANGTLRRAVLRDAPDAVAPHTWRIDGRRSVAHVRRALTSMVSAIRAAHADATRAARVSAQSVVRAMGTDATGREGVDYAFAMTSAEAWTTRLGKQPPFAALALAMPGGVPVSRANVRALLVD